MNRMPDASIRARPVLRRDFLAGLGALAAGTALAQTPAAPPEGPKVKLGLIGCGGRGSWIGKLFLADGGYEITAVSDYFAERATATGDALAVPADRRFAGLDGYKRVLDAKPDAVAIITPPYFHPEQVRAAVDAGIHVYLAKPVAVDVPGCHNIAESSRIAAEKKRCFLVDFQSRADPFYREALKRVHEGAIGKIAFAESTYHAGRLKPQGTVDDSAESRLRNWVFDKALSGDIITEQNIHTLDVLSWIMNGVPVHAFGTCGRKVRVDVGNCNDCFTLHLLYPGQVGVTFNSRQFEGHGTKPDGIVVRAFGDQGVLETAYGGTVMIRGTNFYRGGSSPAIYKDGAAANIAEFRRSIGAGDATNPTVEPSVRSNLLTIFGREAAYSGELVYWEKLVKSDKRIEADLRGLKS